MTRTAWGWLGLGMTLVLAVFAADVATGSDYAFSLFYLIPIGLVTWRVGRRAGALASAASAGAWLVASLWTGVDSSRPQVLVWNTAMQFGFFLVVTGSLTAVRGGLARERALGERLARSYRSLDKEMTIAGHEPPWIARLESGAIESFPCAGGPPMGPFPDARFDGARVGLRPGDTVLFSTDGLSEAVNAQSELFGSERVCAVLRESRAESAETVRDRLVEAVDRHGRGRERADDLTLLVLRRENAPALAAGSGAT